MTKERRSLKNQIPLIVGFIAILSFMGASVKVLADGINQVQNNTKATILHTVKIESHEKRLNEKDVQNARLETKLDYVIELLEKANK